MNHALHLDWAGDFSAGTHSPGAEQRKKVDVEGLMQSCGLCWAQFPVVKYPEHMLVCPALVPQQLHFAFTQSS